MMLVLPCFSCSSFSAASKASFCSVFSPNCVYTQPACSCLVACELSDHVMHCMHKQEQRSCTNTPSNNKRAVPCCLRPGQRTWRALWCLSCVALRMSQSVPNPRSCSQETACCSSQLLCSCAENKFQRLYRAGRVLRRPVTSGIGTTLPFLCISHGKAIQFQ